MSSVVPKLMTAEEFLHMAPPTDGTKVELVRGELLQVCRPGFRHGRTQLRIGAILDQFGHSKQHGRAVVETGMVTERSPDTVRGPDVSYYSIQRLPLDQDPEGYPDVAPELCVEVLSPSNRVSPIREKMGEYFQRGVRIVWIVDPEDRTVAVYRSLDEGHIFHETATLTGEDVLPGFSCRVGDLFA